MVVLQRSAPAPVVERVLDAEQVAAVAARGRLLRVLGAPGSGKTLVAMELIRARVRSGETSADRCVLLTSGRRAAARLRSELTALLAGTSTVPLARTMQSFGFGVLVVAAALRGEPRPRLLSGPEQDVIIAELLRGHRMDGRGPGWPDRFGLALGTRGFRQELRDLFMRTVELGLGPEQLAALGRELGRPEWVAGARVLEEYDGVTALGSPGAHDPAWLLGAAATRIRHDAEVAARVAGALDLVVVDDAQELTPAGLRLLESLLEVNGGLSLVLLGDPDAATQTFRGADPRIIGHRWSELGEGRTLLLRTDHRCARPIRAVADRVTGHIGVLGEIGHRCPRPRRGRAGFVGGELAASGGSGSAADPGALVEVHQVRTVAQEAEFIAARLRRAHLLEGRDWSELAVIVRGRARTATVRRALVASGVPVVADSTETPVRDEAAVIPLLDLLAIVVALEAGRVDRCEPQVAVDVLTSRVGGVDAVTLRRLRRSLRAAELAGGGSRSSDELLASCLAAPGLLVNIGDEAASARRVAGMISAGRRALRAGFSADGVLWAIWDAASLAEAWRRQALAGGTAGARADRDLDAVVALFDTVTRFVDRLPRAGVGAFLDHVRGQDVPGDTLAPRAAYGAAVEVLTPQAAAGREWELVVVAGVQEGVWPDLRLRGSLLGSSELVDLVTGRASTLHAGSGGGSWVGDRSLMRGEGHGLDRRFDPVAGGDSVAGADPVAGVGPAGGVNPTAGVFRRINRREATAAIRFDETRLFHVAVTRARTQLVVTAVRSDDEQPSPYLDVVDPLADGAERAFSTVQHPMTLAALVGELRREVVADDASVRGSAVTSLARLAASRVPGADPSQWWSLIGQSDDRLRRPEGALVQVSPSAIDSFQTCPLRWMLVQSGGDGPPIGAASIGTLVHEIAAEHEGQSEEELRTALAASWPRLGFRQGWISDRQRGRAELMLTRLARWFADSAAVGWRRLAAEQSMRATLGRVQISATLDRIEVGPSGELRVIDYKTGRSKPREADLRRHPQLGAYQVVLEEADENGRPPGIPAGARVAGAALVHLGRAAGATGRPSVQVQSALADDPDDPRWAHQLVAEVGERMAATEFAATPGDHCRICPVRTSCPAQPEGQWI